MFSIDFSIVFLVFFNRFFNINHPSWDWIFIKKSIFNRGLKISKFQYLDWIFSIEDALGLQCMAGSVQSLAKVDTPTGAGEFRPVTVLGLLYRLWSSHHSRHWLRALAPHLDENLSGNRPGHSPATVWRKILSAIDHSHRDNTVAAGFVVDLVKAYNTLPRYPVLFASKLLGVGQNTLMGWTGALSLIRRHFAIRGSFSEGLRSTTGLPEGCGLSCLGMLVLDALLHRWMDALHPSVSTYTFVDNWEVLVTQEAWLEPAFERLESFVHHLDLELDRRKTYFWSTSASFRAQLRRNGRFVQGSARDLGAHVAYTRQLGNNVLTDRIQSLSSFWDRLLASPGSHALKVKAIVSAAWPRAFHACSSAVVGRRHLDLVRTQTMKALKLQKPGASPWLQFASEGLDPVQWIISSTIKDFRDDPSGVLPCSVAAVHGLLSEAYTPGSLHEILLQRIHQLGWRVVSETAVADSFGVFDLRDTPMQSLHFRMQWAWTRVVAQKVAHRPSLQNFVKVDRGATKLGLQEVGAWEQGVLRRHLNGACTANDRACFWSTNGSTACVLCGQLDSIAHRLWSCSGTAGLRAKVSDFVLAHASSFPEVLSVHGWTLASPYWFEWVQALLELPSAVPSPLKSLPANQIVDLFTDGSCLWPDQPRYRLASFAVVWAEPLSFAPSASQCSVLAAAGLSGVIQTAYTEPNSWRCVWPWTLRLVSVRWSAFGLTVQACCRVLLPWPRVPNVLGLIVPIMTCGNLSWHLCESLARTVLLLWRCRLMKTRQWPLMLLRVGLYKGMLVLTTLLERRTWTDHKVFGRCGNAMPKQFIAMIRSDDRFVITLWRWRSFGTRWPNQPSLKLMNALEEGGHYRSKNGFMKAFWATKIDGWFVSLVLPFLNVCCSGSIRCGIPASLWFGSPFLNSLFYSNFNNVKWEWRSVRASG